MCKHLLTLLLAALVGACASLGPPLPPPPTTAEIVQMAKDGITAEEIIKRIDASRAVYPLTASQLADLREKGVPGPVIDHMQRTYIEAVRFEEFLRARDAYFMWGWPSFRGGFWSPYGWPPPYWGGWRP
jgi:hypothetical protein